MVSTVKYFYRTESYLQKIFFNMYIFNWFKYINIHAAIYLLTVLKILSGIFELK